MEYREAVNYILEIPKFTKKNKPEHTKDFLYLSRKSGEKLKSDPCGRNERERLGVYLSGCDAPCGGEESGIVHLSPSCKRQMSGS